MAQKMVHEIKEIIATLSQAEGWPEAQRARLLDLVSRQPIFTLADDLTYFRQRLSVLRAADTVAEITGLSATPLGFPAL
ncbi:hypothetical protein VSR17_20855 [Cupriavidus taiwanensis]|uniref:hypothetical protein n=1 Tax=Cupriavidus taiwanensis TaxID=164546 RepID=UPI0011C04288|nr:hypothetical protein [Cupriavidus taiwanensis]